MSALNNVLKLFADVWKWTLIVSNKKIVEATFDKVCKPYVVQDRTDIHTEQDRKEENLVRELTAEENVIVDALVESLKKDIDILRKTPSQKFPIYVRFNPGNIPQDGDIRCHISHRLKIYEPEIKIKWQSGLQLSLQL